MIHVDYYGDLTNKEPSTQQIATNARKNNACITLSTNKWDDQILKILKIPKEILPVVKDCAADFGYTDPTLTGTSYPITGMVGDQQAAYHRAMLF